MQVPRLRMRNAASRRLSGLRGISQAREMNLSSHLAIYYSLDYAGNPFRPFAGSRSSMLFFATD